MTCFLRAVSLRAALSLRREHDGLYIEMKRRIDSSRVIRIALQASFYPELILSVFLIWLSRYTPLPQNPFPQHSILGCLYLKFVVRVFDHECRVRQDIHPAASLSASNHGPRRLWPLRMRIVGRVSRRSSRGVISREQPPFHLISLLSSDHRSSEGRQRL